MYEAHFHTFATDGFRWTWRIVERVKDGRVELAVDHGTSMRGKRRKTFASAEAARTFAAARFPNSMTLHTFVAAEVAR